jgi:hypothetical protein
MVAKHIIRLQLPIHAHPWDQAYIYKHKYGEQKCYSNIHF